jgi:putative ABC transport system permease protein
MTSARLALSGLLHQPGRTAVSVVGAAFAVVLVFMQLGFLGAVKNTATLLYGKLNYDLLLASSEYVDMSQPGSVVRERLAQARSTSGVSAVVPVSLGMALWRNPTADPDKGGRKWQLSVIGVDPGQLDRTFLPPGRGGIFASDAEQTRKQSLLGRLDVVLLDERSRPDFGDPAAMPPEVTRAELNGRAVTLGGYFRVGTGFSYTGLLLTNEQTFREHVGASAGRVTFGLVQLEPGTDPAEVKRRLLASLPPDVLVFTRAELEARETNYWVNRTAVGQMFFFGVLLAVTVGGIFIYQMMTADITRHLPEYATLKAIGYRFGFLFRIVVWQSAFLAVAGYILGLVAAFGLYEVARAAARLPIGMTADRLLTVFALTLGMCVVSGVLAVRKVRRADPADLF